MRRLYQVSVYFLFLFVSVGFYSACEPVNVDIDNPVKIVDEPQDIKAWFEYLCSPELGGRYSGSDGIRKAMNYISDVIGRSDSLRIDSFSTDKCDMNNIIFHIQGECDSLIVLGAHYDAYGYSDKTPLPGADDNMSGCAVLLKTIKYFQGEKVQPHYSIDIVFFDGEEIGRYGSSRYLRQCGQGIKEYINVDTCGNKEYGIALLYDSKHPMTELDSKRYLGFVTGIRSIIVSVYNPKGYTTDCEPFERKSIPFISIQNDTHVSYLHAVNDNLSNISFNRIDYLAQGMNRFLRNR